MRPLPVYPEDARVPELRVAEQFVVVSLRSWHASAHDPGHVLHHWRAGFAAAGCEDSGATAFDALCRSVAAGARRPLDVRRMRCLRLGRDEAVMLHLVGCTQRNRLDQAEALLGAWVAAAAARLALPAAVTFAAALNGAGLGLPHRPAQAYAGRGGGLALVH